MELLSALDSAFLAAETEHMTLNVGAILIFEGETASPLQRYEVLLRTVASRIHLLPRFRQIPEGLFLDSILPHWADDASFSLIDHVHVAPADSSITFEELLIFSSSVLERKLDRSKPLWDIYLVPSLGDSGFAIVLILHHAMADGRGVVDLLMSLLDTSRDFDGNVRPRPYFPTEKRSVLEAIAGTLVAATRSVVGSVGSLPNPESLLEKLRAVDTGAVVRFAELIPIAKRTAVNGSISGHQRILAHTLRFSAVKAMAAELGVSVNDVLVGLSHCVMVRYLERQAMDVPDALVTMIPISTRRGQNTSSGNELSAILVEIPSNLESLRDSITTAHSRISPVRLLWEQLGEAQIESLAKLFPTSLLASVSAWAIQRSEIFRRVPPPFNYAVSNIRGPGTDMFLAGSRLVRAIPLAPIADGSGTTFTFLSYGNDISLGLTIDPSLYPDADSLEAVIKEITVDLTQPHRND